MVMQKIRCNGVRYRQGFLEVLPNVHPEHINLEIWNIHPERDISTVSLESASISDDSIIANAEIELSLQQANALVEMLQVAIQKVKDKV